MTERGALPPKLYFRIGEVAGLVGVEPHVLRYWEREFRSIRPSKSAKGQRVYSRRDVENLLRVRELLYGQGFTIAGARRRLRDRDHDGDKDASEVRLESAAPASQPMATTVVALESSSPLPELSSRVETEAPSTAVSHGEGLALVPARHLSTTVRRELESLRAEVESLLAELG